LANLELSAEDVAELLAHPGFAKLQEFEAPGCGVRTEALEPWAREPWFERIVSVKLDEVAPDMPYGRGHLLFAQWSQGAQALNVPVSSYWSEPGRRRAQRKVVERVMRHISEIESPAYS